MQKQRAKLKEEQMKTIRKIPMGSRDEKQRIG
jgi:hypothetical protein